MQKKEILSLLELIEQNGDLSELELAIMLNLKEIEIHETIESLRNSNIICGYHTLINWDKVTNDYVKALVELRVTPQGGDGYERLAEKIKEYPQVKALYLLSGSYDFLVLVDGKNIKEISLFVSSKLASINEVQSTTTHFVLRKYKDFGVNFDNKKVDERMVVTP